MTIFIEPVSPAYRPRVIALHNMQPDVPEDIQRDGLLLYDLAEERYNFAAASPFAADLVSVS